MDLDTHIDILINKYDLGIIYKKYILLSILNSGCKEGFYICLIYFSGILKNNPEKIYKFCKILFSLLMMQIPLDYYLDITKQNLLKELKKANSKYFFERILKTNKMNILQLDLHEFNNIIESFNDSLDLYINNIKIKYDIPIRFISLFFIGLNNEIKMLIELFFINVFVVKVLNDNILLDELTLNIDHFKYKNIIRNYVINSKNLIINNEMNIQYFNDIINKYENTNKDINNINNIFNIKVDLSLLIYSLTVLGINSDKLSASNFLYYFLIIYDIEYINDKIREYYKNNMKINLYKLNDRLKYLYKFIPSEQIPISPTNNNNNNKIVINKIINKLPYLNIQNIEINQNDHILIDGVSGSGKTSLLYVFKGIIKPDIIDISPDINIINSQCYLILAEYKNIYNDYLYNIITNYETNPNVDIIKLCIDTTLARNNYDNIFININEISSGEKIRLIICKIIYSVIKYNYNILLFDEIDEHLNNELAVTICQNIRKIFNNKIILYITHNENIKKLFNKRIQIIKN
jgi:ABC-type lipoprotein export system ATPase subunit